ncbi:aspartyl-phosphate phosphatase Spo0E family protein [Robertmurraya andreesenii]|uniref:Aspartyl-phosphate phosphatase Spo0E family protein n=1 Tax=Anoxybacillus andreesenii TaxID=1325932 RepID=A0ABT9V387_9BACL|nr:aspartyl-phosphate phosphatase Spo0E family protein [Robertmurraya andreesenii]MDQ0155407.1 hypothetical protein [Robertmurraya andreesenii]
MAVLANEKKLVNMIETLRKEMIQSGMKEGLSSKKTIELSQLLDQYMLKYQKTTYKI